MERCEVEVFHKSDGKILPYRLLFLSNGRFSQRRLVMLFLEAALRVLAVGFVDADSVPLLPGVVFSVFARVQIAEVPHDERLDQQHCQSGY